MAKKRRKKSLKGQTKSESKVNFLTRIGIENSKNLRENATPYEKILYQYLKDLHYKFEFQVPIITNKSKLYIADFVLTDYQLIIEADGVSTHGTKEAIKADKLRTKRLNKEGYTVLRFWNRQISTFTKEQIDQIIKLQISQLSIENINKLGKSLDN